MAVITIKIGFETQQRKTPNNFCIVPIFIIKAEKQYYCISPLLCQILPSLLV